MFPEFPAYAQPAILRICQEAHGIALDGGEASLLTVISLWISNHIHHIVWYEIAYHFPNFDGATIEVCEWIKSFIAHFSVHVITDPCWY